MTAHDAGIVANLTLTFPQTHPMLAGGVNSPPVIKSADVKLAMCRHHG